MASSKRSVLRPLLLLFYSNPECILHLTMMPGRSDLLVVEAIGKAVAHPTIACNSIIDAEGSSKPEGSFWGGWGAACGVGTCQWPMVSRAQEMITDGVEEPFENMFVDILHIVEDNFERNFYIGDLIRQNISVLWLSMPWEMSTASRFGQNFFVGWPTST